MKHLKIFENYTEDWDKLVKCNWCDWFGTEKELNIDDNGDENCPNCYKDDYIMDVDSFGDDFFEYIKDNKPTPNINKKDYNNIEDYYKALYPYYFIEKQYNL